MELPPPDQLARHIVGDVGGVAAAGFAFVPDRLEPARYLLDPRADLGLVALAAIFEAESANSSWFGLIS